MENQCPGSNWYDKLSNIMNPIFTKDQFNRYLARHKEKLGFYNKWIDGNKILDIGCGFGYTAIPLSVLGYNITALDIDESVIATINQNAKNFGGNIAIVQGDIFKIDDLFDKNSFNISISGGLLEHFREDEIKSILDKQLYVAPRLLADIPIHSNKQTLNEKYSNFDKKICKDGVYRNLWDQEYWTKNILNDYNILYNKVSTSSKDTGSFEKLTLVLEQN